MAAYDIHATSPAFVFEFADFDREWDIISSVLSPENVSFAAAAQLQPDYGIAVVKMGSPPGTQWLFHFVKLRDFMCVHDDLFTMSAVLPIADVDHLISFDTNRPGLDQILSCTDAENQKAILQSLSPGKICLSPKPVFVSLDTIIGEPTRGAHHEFIPFVVQGATKLSESLYEAVVQTDAT